MKKTARKLSLNRETLRNLEETDLRNAAGGLSAGAAPTRCISGCVACISRTECNC
jgi:hypothetical protein